MNTPHVACIIAMAHGKEIATVSIKQLMLELDDGTDSFRKEFALPRQVDRVRVPPIKCQGIKTKLVPFILSSLLWDGAGRWIEPFVGSSVVALNVAPPRALLTDANVHLVRFYKDIASGLLNPKSVKEYLQREGDILLQHGEEYYYKVRERFNANPSSHDFLFLNRACFNGVIRFNSKGKFNVPFGKKPDRFRSAYITKIVNQVAHIARVMSRCDWEFEEANWRETLAQARESDFVYADPPYMGRHTDYYSNWTEDEASELLSHLQSLPCGFALSTWKKNKYRQNPYLPSYLPGITIVTVRHFYHVGSTENLRNAMEEALVIKDGFAVSN